MKTKELNYDLPPERIAQQPAQTRSRSKLLVLNRQGPEIIDSAFCRIANFLRPGDCLVINDTKVVPAKFFARKITGGKLEGLFLDEKAPGVWEVMLKGAGKIGTGGQILLLDKKGNTYCRAKLVEKGRNGNCTLEVEKAGCAEKILRRVGFAPLPPYIKRTGNIASSSVDRRRYQTVYAAVPGAVAAPTAGLHFTKRLIKQLESKAVVFARITLHVGQGTFRPVTTENLQNHKMHCERFIISRENARIINIAKSAGQRVIAVGTTTVRALETAAEGSIVKSADTATDLFITPGYNFKIIDAMITNFHLPRSTLLAMVAGFAGMENIRTAYEHAVKQKYRFYSYGDAMFII